MGIGEIIQKFLGDSGIVQFFTNANYGWQNAVMLIVAFVLLYLAIFRSFEPYLLIPIAFGMLLVNLPIANVADKIFVYVDSAEYDLANGVDAAGGFIKYNGHYFGGLLGYLYLGVKTGIYPCLIFLGIGATTDFGPLIANPKSMLLGAAAQIGIFITFFGAILLGFNAEEASSIGIIGGADGPTAILVTTKLADHLLPAISVAAYSYMALVPAIQPPIIRLLTTKKERAIKMQQLRPVSKIEKILFPIVVSTVAILLVPSCAPLIGCLMLGNLFKESGVVPHLVDTAGNALLYIVTILLGVCVGATADGQNFLRLQTLMIFGLGILAFAVATASGVLGGKLMCKLTRGKVNPMIGAAGVSAVPMAARVVQKEGQREDPTNFLLMHAMGPNVAGVIGSAIAAGILLSMFG
ncbi:MAG: sodium ion-translocating decarboxylase subunit beta [Bacilli bacterium]|nr:sodium ion-translocating decarboxylase subunit beta [Bacilli bacterium]MBO7536240.1 sodium ion-translocating decarboxylase subunit beta [Bacilli bacterium]